MNILFITSCFPSFDVKFNDPRTKFVYYYAAEWVKQGHNVLILHSVPKYPRIFSMGVALVEHYLKFDKLQLKRFWQNPEAVKASDYVYEGIHVIRTPINKIIPHTDYLSMELNRHISLVVEKFNRKQFEPDIIFSDFLTPAIYIADRISKTSNAVFCQIMHQTDFDYLKKHQKLQCMLNSSSSILLRSYSHRNLIDQYGFSSIPVEYMFTGVPNETNLGKPRKRVKKLLYVGLLIKRKFLDVVIKSMNNSKGRGVFELEVVGAGPCEKELRDLVNELGIEDRVSFLGKLPREEVFSRMQIADCFIMPSKNETFGMVYIEAMSQGCVVIASKDEGVDGIIIDGENGFLVEAGNVSSLTEVLDELCVMDTERVYSITKNAIDTSSRMSDGYLAKDLLDKLTKDNLGGKR